MVELAAQQFATTLLSLSENHDLNEVTTTDIISSSGLGRQTFYNHFHDKYQLITWIFKEDTYSGVTKNHTESWQDIMTSVFVTINKRRSFYQRAFSMQGQNSLHDYLHQSDHQLYLTLYQQLTDNIPMTEDMTFAMDFYSNGCFESTVAWLQLDHPNSPQEHARQVWLSMPFILREALPA